jgi:hypothetical protein
MLNSFRKLNVVALAWLGMFSFAVFGHFWMKAAAKWHPKLRLAIYLAYQLIYALSAAYVTLKFNLPPGKYRAY